MRFDSTPYYHVGEPYYAIGWDALMSEVRKEAQLLEDAGFTTMWFAEHHFAWDGYYNAAPNPLLVAADLIPRTKTLRLGALGTALPDRHPIHVAEDVAMLDRMSEGRMEFGIMRGANNRAGVQFHPAADRRNKEVELSTIRRVPGDHRQSMDSGGLHPRGGVLQVPSARVAGVGQGDNGRQPSPLRG